MFPPEAFPAKVRSGFASDNAQYSRQQLFKKGRASGLFHVLGHIQPCHEKVQAGEMTCFRLAWGLTCHYCRAAIRVQAKLDIVLMRGTAQDR